MVFAVLELYEEARNCDATLYARLYAHYFGDHILDEPARDFLVRIMRKDIPDPDNIRRWRAVIQNKDGDFLPTDPEVRRQRKQSEEEWYELMSPSGADSEVQSRE